MVPPVINRKRGKTKEQRRRDIGREKKSNAKAAGKKRRHGLGKDLTRRSGAGKIGAPTKKKMKKREQRAKLAKVAKQVIHAQMEY